MEGPSCLFPEKMVPVSLKPTATVSVHRRNQSATIRSYWGGLTCSPSVSNTPQKHRGLFVICRCLFNKQNQLRCRKATPGTVAGGSGMEQVCPCPCTSPLRSQELSHLSRGSPPRSNDLNLCVSWCLCACRHWG